MRFLRFICKLRGQHVARKPTRPALEFRHGSSQPSAVACQFRCICGAITYRTFDFNRGGRIPVPFAWPLEEQSNVEKYRVKPGEVRK